MGKSIRECSFLHHKQRVLQIKKAINVKNFWELRVWENTLFIISETSLFLPCPIYHFSFFLVIARVCTDLLQRSFDLSYHHFLFFFFRLSFSFLPDVIPIPLGCSTLSIIKYRPPMIENDTSCSMQENDISPSVDHTPPQHC